MPFPPRLRWLFFRIIFSWKKVILQGHSAFPRQEIIPSLNL